MAHPPQNMMTYTGIAIRIEISYGIHIIMPYMDSREVAAKKQISSARVYRYKVWCFANALFFGRCQEVVVVG